jgi:hypothetical protein
MLLGGWLATEPEAELRVRLEESLGQRLALPDRLRHPQRRLQWLATRLALHQLTDAQTVRTLGHTPDGRPYLPGWGSISISHTGTVGVVLLGQSPQMALDAEWLNRPFDPRMFGRVLSPDERAQLGPTPAPWQFFLHWTGKEALYKAFCEKFTGVEFARHLRLRPPYPAELPDQGRPPLRLSAWVQPPQLANAGARAASLLFLQPVDKLLVAVASPTQSDP